MKIFFGIILFTAVAKGQTMDCLVDFSTIQQRVFEPQCIQCHNPAKSKGDVLLDTYASVQSHLSKIKVVIENDEMPPKTSLEALDKELLLKWINDGAPEVVDPTKLCELSL